MKSPVAVLISDIHYDLSTLEIADRATNMAVDKANELGVPLIATGDTHNSKANLRGECVKRMVETFRRCKLPPIILVGNHDRINEKAPEHSLEFLRPYATIVDRPMKNLIPYWNFIPYNHDPEELKAYIQTLPRGSNIIMHQGLKGSNSGEYIQDKSAITIDDIDGLNVLSGHYHARQSIRLPTHGSHTFLGNPYTLTFGEANDPEKGFHVLYDDGSLQFIPTKLRKHIVRDLHILEFQSPECPQWNGNPDDLLWVKIRGPKDQLYYLGKKEVGKSLNAPHVFKLDLIPTDTTPQAPKKEMSSHELLDALIDSTDSSESRKVRLKELWRSLA